MNKDPWPRSRTGILAFSSFITGVFLASGFDLPFSAVYLLLLFGSIFTLLGFSRGSKVLIIGIGFIGIALGIFRMTEVISYELPLPEGNRHAGLIIESTLKDTYQELVLRLEGDQKILVRTQLLPQFFRGETIFFEGTIKPTREESFENYRKQLERRQILGIVSYPKAIQHADQEPITFIGILEKGKVLFTDSLKAHLPEPDASFIAGITIGERTSIPNELREAFADTSTSHLVALSGYNITIVGMAVTSLFSYFHLSQRLKLFLTAFLIICFVMLAGASPSIVRAAVMGVLALLARERGRTFEMTNALIFAAAVMIYINPHILTLDLSFQLSFLATLGIILVPPLFDGRLLWLPKFLREVVLATIGAELFVFPLILWHFGEISLIGLFANFLIVPLIPYTMGMGAATGLLGIVLPVLAAGVGSATHLLVSYELGVVRLFAEFPGASVALPKYAAYIIALPALFLTFRMMTRRLFYGVASH